jgi:putative membrane protein
MAKLHSWDPKWRSAGKEPDYRFSLANERTFLAWIRTALALLAGGILIEQFARNVSPPWLLAALAVALASLGAVLCVLSYARWKSNDLAMRLGAPLPMPVGVPLLAAIAAAVGVAVVILLPFQR